MADETAGTATEQPAGDDIRSALTAAIATHEAPASPAAKEPERAEPEPTTATGAEGDKAAARDEKTGKFVKSDKEQPDKKDAPTDEKAPVSDPKKESATKTGEPPANWSEADKKTFKGLPQAAQTFLLDRHKAMEADYTKKTQEIASLKRDYEPVAQLFAPHADVMKQKGFTPSSLITAWFNVEKALMEGRGVDIIKGLIPAYKIDQAKLLEALGVKAQTEPAADPAKVAAEKPSLHPDIQKELDEARAWRQQQDAEKANTAQRQRAEAERRIMGTIEEFKSAKDDKGTLQHPYFEEVEADMAALAQAATAARQPVPDLNTLYEKAVWANPSTRAKLQESQRAADEAQRAAKEEEARKEARAKAEKARKASSSVTGAPGPGQSPAARQTGSKSLRETIVEAAASAA